VTSEEEKANGEDRIRSPKLKSKCV